MDDSDERCEKVLILPLSEDSKKITQTLSNATALKILEHLAQEPMSATAIADEMKVALTTVKYNLDALIGSDLIRVKQTRWSRKGREIKIYEPVQKLIVVVPGRRNPDRSSIIGMLKKYLVMVGGAVLASGGVEYLSRFANAGMVSAPATPEHALLVEELPLPPPNETFNEGARAVAAVGNETGNLVPVDAAGSVPLPASTTAEVAAEVLAKGAEPVAAPAAEAIGQGLASHVGLWFFFGCMSVIVILMLWEMYYRKKSI